MTDTKTLKIPGWLHVAFATQRREMLLVGMDLARMGPPSSEERDLLFNAIDILSKDLWETQLALQAARSQNENIVLALRGLNGLADQQEMLLEDVLSGRPLRGGPGGPEDVRNAYKDAQKALEELHEDT